MASQKQQLIDLIKEACQQGARQAAACDLVGITVRTFQRWLKAGDDIEDKRRCPDRVPANKLSASERQQLLDIANQAPYATLPPSKIVPLLADEGRYIASESTFYRVLKAEDQLKHRNATRPQKANKPRALVATQPNQIYSWDITYLPTTIKGIFVYLYLMMDVYSRKIVGWQVHGRECSEHAANLLMDVCRREGIDQGQVTLHSDNGSPMKGATMLATLQQLGVIPSFSRPSVSNDNPYSESLFKTLKYCPEYPETGFATLNNARLWVERFVQWYNHKHLHSSIKFVTPDQRHRGADIEILAKRHQVYRQAYDNHPARWSGNTRNWEHQAEVLLNPDKANQISKNIRRAA